MRRSAAAPAKPLITMIVATVSEQGHTESIEESWTASPKCAVVVPLESHVQLAFSSK